MILLAVVSTPLLAIFPKYQPTPNTPMKNSSDSAFILMLLCFLMANQTTGDFPMIVFTGCGAIWAITGIARCIQSR